jgi:hypothetical protein
LAGQLAVALVVAGALNTVEGMLLKPEYGQSHHICCIWMLLLVLPPSQQPQNHWAPVEYSAVKSLSSWISYQYAGEALASIEEPPHALDASVNGSDLIAESDPPPVRSLMYEHMVIPGN